MYTCTILLNFATPLFLFLITFGLGTQHRSDGLLKDAADVLILFGRTFHVIVRSNLVCHDFTLRGKLVDLMITLKALHMSLSESKYCI